MTARTIAGCVVVGGGLFVSSAYAEPIPVYSFRDMWGEPAGVKTVKSRYDQRLMINHGGAIESVGLDGSSWHIGFVDYREGETHIIGYAQNFLNVYGGYEGFMWGLYAYEMNLDEDLKADDVFIVQDVLGDGIGVMDEGEWIPGSDDVFYNANDVLFGADQIRGDVSQLPAYGASRYLPLMVISDGQVPLDGDLNGDGFVGLDDLDIVLNAWNQNVPPGDARADVSGAGGEPDGYVGLDDLDVVLNNWNAGTPPAVVLPEPASVGVVLVGAGVFIRRRV